MGRKNLGSFRIAFCIENASNFVMEAQVVKLTEDVIPGACLGRTLMALTVSLAN